MRGAAMAEMVEQKQRVRIIRGNVILDDLDIDGDSVLY